MLGMLGCLDFLAWSVRKQGMKLVLVKAPSKGTLPLLTLLYIRR